MSMNKLAYSIRVGFVKRANTAKVQKALMGAGLAGTAGFGLKTRSLLGELAENKNMYAKSLKDSEDLALGRENDFAKALSAKDKELAAQKNLYSLTNDRLNAAHGQIKEVGEQLTAARQQGSQLAQYKAATKALRDYEKYEADLVAKGQSDSADHNVIVQQINLLRKYIDTMDVQP